MCMCLCVCVCVGFSLCVHGCVFSCRHLLCLCMCVCLYLCVRVCVLLLHTRSVFVLFTFLCGVATLFISVSLFLFNDKSPIFFEHHSIGGDISVALTYSPTHSVFSRHVYRTLCRHCFSSPFFYPYSHISSIAMTIFFSG